MREVAGPAGSVGLAAFALLTGIGHLVVPLLGIPLPDPSSVGPILNVVATAAPVLVGAGLLRARPRRATAWLVPPLVVHLVRTAPALPSLTAGEATVVWLQGTLALAGLVILGWLWWHWFRVPGATPVARRGGADARGPARPEEARVWSATGVADDRPRSAPARGARRTSRWLLAAAAVAAMAPLVPAAGFRMGDGPPTEGWWTTTLVGADVGFAVFVAVQILVVFAGIGVVARLPAPLGGTAAVAWALPVAVAGVVAAAEAALEPILVPLPLAGVTTLAALTTLALGQRVRRH